MDPRSTLIGHVLVLSLRLLMIALLLSPLDAESSSQSVGATGYHLGPNDVIRIQVYGEEDLSIESKIDGDGNIRLPLLGTILVGGKTITELQETLTERLAAGYVRNPRVTIYIVKHRNFYLSGGVRSPGGYSYEEGLNVQKAISLAGGLTEKAERGALHILRRVGGQEETIPVQLDTLVHPDDIIVVAEGQKFFVSGEVKTPGRYLYEKSLSVSKALGLAGGRTDKAEKSTVKVTRLTSGLAETFALSSDAEVLPDDILVVEPEHHKFYASGEVKTPGGYPYQESLTVHRAVAMAGGLTEKAERGALHILRRVGDREETIPVQLDTLVLPDDIIVVAEGRRFYVSGEVKTPGRYLYEKSLSVSKALGLAGGRTDKAEKSTVKVTRLTSGLAETFALSPDAEVLPDDILVVEPEHHKFYASGEVKTPGGYPYQESLTVHRAVAMAGGLTEKAERGALHTLRRVGDREETIPVQLDTLVLPDDIIVVAEGRRFYVSGEVKTPGRYLYEKGMTVHKAVSMAGGWTEKAEKSTILVTRLTDNVAHTVEIALDAPLLPDDFIVAPQLKKIYVNGEVKRAGDFPYGRGLTVHQVITMAGGFTDKAAENSTKILRKINGQEQSIQANLDTIILPEDIVVVPRSFF